MPHLKILTVSDIKVGSVFSCIWGKFLAIVLCFTFYLPGFWKSRDCYTISSWRTPIVWAVLFLPPPTPIWGTVTSRRINSRYDTLGSYSSVAEDSSYLGHALSTGTQLLTYQRIIMPTYSWSSSPRRLFLWNMVTADQLALPNIPEDLNVQNIHTNIIKKLRFM